MDRRTVFTKTAKGMLEATGSTSALPRDLRNILKEVDGKATVSQLGERLGKMPEAKLLDVLIEMQLDGYVREFVTVQPRQTSAPPPQGTAPGGDEDLDFTSLTSKPGPKAEEAAKPAADEIARQAAAARARADAEAKARLEARAKAEAVVKARLEAEAKAKAEAEAKAKADAEAKAKAEAEARAKTAAEAKARAEAEAKAKSEAEAKARAQAEARAKAEAEERARREAEERVRREADEKARREAEERAQREAQERARVEAELTARLEEERRAREEAERKAKEEAQRLAREAEERARRETEELRAQVEAERRAREEAEQRAQQEVERRAREESERKLREEAERREREDAERRAEEEAERKEREETERRAKEEVERREREDAERRDREESERKLREEAERKEREEAERREREETDRRAKEEAERREREETERRVKEEAERREREDAERKAKEEAERREREDAERRAEEEAERREREETERRAEEEAERKDREESERKLREEAERGEREETERTAKEEAEASRAAEPEPEREAEEAVHARTPTKEESKARAKLEAAAAAQARKDARARERALATERKAAGIEAPSRPAEPEPSAEMEMPVGKLRRERNWARIVSLGLFVVLFVAIAAIHLIPLDVSPYEKAAGERLGEPVRIGSIHFSLVPQPHLSFENVSIGAEPRLQIASLDAVPELGSMFAPRKVFRSIEIGGLVLPQAIAARALWGKGSEDALRVERVYVKGLKLELKGMLLPPLDVEASFGPGGLEKALLANAEKSLSVSLQGDGGKTQIEIAAKRLVLPFAQNIALDEFSAKGTLVAQDLLLREFEARAFDGVLTGNARLSWGDAWSFGGEFAAKGMDAAKVAAPILSGGRFEGKGVYAMKADAPEKLMASARLDGSFSMQKGTLAIVDLTRTLQGTGGTGGNTLFSEMTGSVVADASRIQLRQIRLSAGLLSANGSAELDAQKNLSGRLQIELRAQVTQLRATLAITGTLAEPQFRRSN